jgi:hypothetical protein
MFGKDDKIEKIAEAMSYVIEDVGRIEARVIELEKTVFSKSEGEKRLQSTIKGFENDDDFDRVYNICAEISGGDETFKFDGDRDSREIFIYSENKDELHKKSLWLVFKTGVKGLKYTIRERK